MHVIRIPKRTPIGKQWEPRKEISELMTSFNVAYSIMHTNTLDKRKFTTHAISAYTKNYYIFIDDIRTILSMDLYSKVSIPALGNTYSYEHTMYTWVVDDDGFMMELTNDRLLSDLTLMHKLIVVYETILSELNGTARGNVTKVVPFIKQIQRILNVITDCRL